MSVGAFGVHSRALFPYADRIAWWEQQEEQFGVHFRDGVQCFHYCFQTGASNLAGFSETAHNQLTLDSFELCE